MSAISVCISRASSPSSPSSSSSSFAMIAGTVVDDDDDVVIMVLLWRVEFTIRRKECRCRSVLINKEYIVERLRPSSTLRLWIDGGKRVRVDVLDYVSLSLSDISQRALLDECTCTCMGFLCSCSGRTTSSDVRFLFRSMLLCSASYSMHIIVGAVRCFFFPSLLSLLSLFFVF